MSWYRSGSIAVTNGSTSVVGTSTAFIANVAIGEGLLAPDGKVYEITAVTSDTGLTLGSAYLGSNASGQAYAIIPSQSYVRDLASQAATLVNSYQSVKDNAGSGKFGDGTVGSPGIQFSSDSDTGIRRTGANAIALVTGGADRVTLDANGTLAVTHNSSANAMTITQTGAGNAFVVEDSASTDSTPFLIDSTGVIVSGHTSPVVALTYNSRLQLNTWYGLQHAHWSADALGPNSFCLKSRSATVGTHAVVLNGDNLGRNWFAGSDGTNFIGAAMIEGYVDGTPGPSDMPGRLVFSTTADGASSPTERMRIDSAGAVKVVGDLVVYGAGRLGYATGAGGAVTQATSRTTGVTLNKTNGAITLFTSAGSATAASFTVTNSTVAATDTIVLSVKSATNKYLAFVTAVAAGSFEITFQTTGGTSSDAPVINFAVLKAVAA